MPTITANSVHHLVMTSSSPQPDVMVAASCFAWGRYLNMASPAQGLRNVLTITRALPALRFDTGRWMPSR